MARPVIAEMVVVGGGAIGASVAYRLAQAGVGVTLVEQRFPGAGISGASFSWVNSFDKKPAIYHQLNVRGIGEHWALAAELGSHDLLHLDGALSWGGPDAPAGGSKPAGEAATDAAAGPAVASTADSASASASASGTAGSMPYRGQSSEMGRGRLAAKVNATRVNGYLIEEITPDEAMELEPDLVIDRDSVPVVYLMPMEGWVETAALAHRLATAAARRHGLRLRQGVSVDGVARSGGEITGVRLSDGTTISADMVINAAGPDGGRFAAMAGGLLPVQNSIGINLVTSPIASQLRRVIHAGPVQLRPESSTRVMVGGQNIDGTLVPGEPFALDDPRALAELFAAAEVMPALRHAAFEGARIGLRAIPGDGLSAIGPDPVVGGLYHVITHSGATLSALVGRLACADLLGANPPELEPFRPARFATGGSRGHAGSDE
jgi:glycine/D-amino acid oxidase-like deaminating enzyme